MCLLSGASAAFPGNVRLERPRHGPFTWQRVKLTALMSVISETATQEATVSSCAATANKK